MTKTKKGIKKPWRIVIPVIVVVVLIFALLPNILHLMGMHPTYAGETVTAVGKRALIITTSTSTLGDGGAATGVYSSELTIPYYIFLDSGMDVDIASIAGGEIPIEPMSVRYPLVTEDDKRAEKDAAFQKKVSDSISVSDIRVEEYDLIFIAGGWGAAYDLGQSAILGEKITEANARGIVLGAVCHGVLGFLQAYETEGKPLVEGKRMTCVTNKQIEELNITQTPLHPETELKKAGAFYESATAFRDIFATHVVVGGNIVTGQNQNSGAATAHIMLNLLRNSN